jgi:hypothetical protein
MISLLALPSCLKGALRRSHHYHLTVALNRSQVRLIPSTAGHHFSVESPSAMISCYSCPDRSCCGFSLLRIHHVSFVVSADLGTLCGARLVVLLYRHPDDIAILVANDYPVLSIKIFWAKREIFWTNREIGWIDKALTARQCLTAPHAEVGPTLAFHAIAAFRLRNDNVTVGTLLAVFLLKNVLKVRGVGFEEAVLNMRCWSLVGDEFSAVDTGAVHAVGAYGDMSSVVEGGRWEELTTGLGCAMASVFGGCSVFFGLELLGFGLEIWRQIGFPFIVVEPLSSTGTFGCGVLGHIALLKVVVPGFDDVALAGLAGFRARGSYKPLTCLQTDCTDAFLFRQHCENIDLDCLKFCDG